RSNPQRPERFNRAEYDARITPIKVDPRVVPYLDLFPLPGQGGTVLLEELRDPGTGLLDGLARVSGLRRNLANEDFGAVKIDHQYGADQRDAKGFEYAESDNQVQPRSGD